MQVKEDDMYKFFEKRDFSEEDYRFMQDLEFVQSLSNVYYLQWLCNNKYFEDPAFLEYIKYLQYWKQPQYAKYIVYPECFFFLDKLLDESFRYLLSVPGHVEYINTQCHIALRYHKEDLQEKKKSD